MNKTIIPSEALDRLEASLKKCINAEIISRTDRVMHARVSDRSPSMGWLDVAAEKASFPMSRYGVLLEAHDSTAANFIHFGKGFTNEQLAEKFGGCVSNHRYWILYNEKGGMYGYNGDRIPTAEEIIQFIEELYK